MLARTWDSLYHIQVLATSRRLNRDGFLIVNEKQNFIVFYKVDRLFEWKRGPNSGIVDTIKKQKKNTKQEFDERVQIVIKEFSEQVCDFRTCQSNQTFR